MSHKSTCIHEASHSAIALASGIRFIGLLAVKGFSAQILFYPSSTLNPGANKSLKQSLILCATAGAMGQYIADDAEGGLIALAAGSSRSDAQTLSRLGVDLPNLLIACAQTRSYLQQNWEAVERIASALEERAFLSEDEVKEIAGNLPSIFETSKPKKTDRTSAFAAKRKAMTLLSQHSHLAPKNSFWSSGSYIKAISPSSCIPAKPMISSNGTAQRAIKKSTASR